MEDHDELGNPSKIFFLDTNLSSPVLITELNWTKELINKVLLTPKERALTSDDWKVQNEITFFRKLCKLRKWSRSLLTDCPQLRPEDYELVEHEMLCPSREYSSSYDIALDVCSDIERAISAGLTMRGLPSAEIDGVTELLKNIEVVEYRRAYEEFTDLFGRAESRVKQSENKWTHGQVGMVLYWINASCAMIQVAGKLYYSSLNQVLMLKDKLATRYMLLEHVRPLGLDHQLINHLFKLFEWQDTTLSLYGNQAFNILKAVEPMFKTRLSHIVDNVFGDDTAYTRMKLKMGEKEEKVRKLTGIYGSDKLKELSSIVEGVDSVRSVVEMFGCLKSCGHPIIDPVLGGLSAAEEAISPDETKLSDAQELRNTFCHTVLVSYIKQHGVWPKLIHMDSSTALRKLNDEQNRNINYDSYPFFDWTTTEWTKILEFDYFPNFLELSDDKSISLYRGDKHLSWDFTKHPESQRRLLLEILTREGLNVKAIVDEVSKRNIPWEWFIVSLYPKEREFKIDPRMFAMLVLEMRYFFTAVEANIADGLFRYLPQQTMTKTKTQNQERFLAFTDPAKQSGDATLFLEIDLTRWNLRWRQLVIHMIGHDLNMMFGMKGTFTVTHWFFEQCQIVVRVPGLKPVGIEMKYPPISGLAWRGHKGGFEGLNQKLWSAATYAMVEMALIPLLKDGTISSYELVGQGDNQVVRLAIPLSGMIREEILPGVRDRVNAALEETCLKVNQIVKPDENIESTAVLTYSKDVYVEGVEYPTSLKKHSRLFPVTSLDFPSVASNTRAILSGAVAGAENALYPLRSAIIGCYHAARYLHGASRGFSIHSRGYPKLDKGLLIAALVLPSSIGGLAGFNLGSFVYKGGSDPLGKEISGMRMMAEGTSEASILCSTALRALEEKYGIAEDPDLTTLIDNPYGLPLAKASSPLSKVGRLTLEAFRPKVKNKEIKPLLSTQVTAAEGKLKDDLVSIEPLNPLLIHDMYEASGFGTVRLMHKMFIHTRTVQNVAQWANPNITHTFLRADLNDTLNFIKWVHGLPRRGYSGNSSYALTTKFRGYWGRDLQGVTTHQPLDCTHVRDSTRSLSSIKWSAHSHADLLGTRGPLSGYVGTATREKRSEHGYKIVDTGTPSRSVTKLQIIRSQAYGSQAFNELLDRIGLTRSPVRLTDITEYLPKVIGGSLIHRYASVMKHMLASYVGPLNFVTHLRLDTDSLGVVSGSTLNYPVMLQEFIVVAQAGAKLNYIHNRAQSGELLFDPSDLVALPENTLTCRSPEFSDVNLPKSVLLYSNSLSLARTYDNVARSIPRHAVVAPAEYETVTRIDESFVGFFVSTLRDQNRAKQIADTRGHASIPSKFQIDIAEAHAYGPLRLLTSIAYAILLTTFRDTFRTLQIHPERWDESLFMVHNISVCLKACAAYWNHPLFMTHRDYPKLRYSKLRYSEGVNRYPRMEAEVRRKLSQVMTNVTHPFWSMPIPVFAGENQTQVAEAMTISGAKCILRLRVMGDPRSALYASLYSGYMRLPKGATLISPDILDLLRVRFLGLSRAVEKQGDQLLASELKRVSNVKTISCYNDDIRTVMRHSRSLKPDVRVTIKSELRSHISNFLTPRDHCQHCYPPEHTKHAVMWSRYRQRVNGGMVSSGYTWLPLITQMKLSSNVLIVGNGNGGLADLLISAYRVSVIGLDLETDMPKDSATLLNYVPLGIQIQNQKSFIQSDWSLTSSGDWTDTVVRKGVLDGLPSLSSVIIDATGPDPYSLSEAIAENMKHNLVSNIYCRLIGALDDINTALHTIAKIHELRRWVVSRSHTDVEVIVEVSRGKLPSHTCSAAPSLSNLTLSAEMHAIIPERRGELLEAAIFNSISWDGETLHEAYLTMRNLCVSLLDKPKTQQLIYRHRYGLMIGYAVMTALQSDNPLGRLQEWIQEDELETDLFYYKLREATVTHLIKYVARLSSLTESSSLYFS